MLDSLRINILPLRLLRHNRLFSSLDDAINIANWRHKVGLCQKNDMAMRKYHRFECFL